MMSFLEQLRELREAPYRGEVSLVFENAVLDHMIFLVNHAAELEKLIEAVDRHIENCASLTHQRPHTNLCGVEINLRAALAALDDDHAM